MGDEQDVRLRLPGRVDRKGPKDDDTRAFYVSTYYYGNSVRNSSAQKHFLLLVPQGLSSCPKNFLFVKTPVLPPVKG